MAECLRAKEYCTHREKRMEFGRIYRDYERIS